MKKSKIIKYLIIIFVTLLMISIINIGQVFASQTDGKTYWSGTTSGITGGLISYDDLQKTNGLFCRQHGTFIGFENTGAPSHSYDEDIYASPTGISDMTVFISGKVADILGINKVTFNNRVIQDGEEIKELYVSPERMPIQWSPALSTLENLNNAIDNSKLYNEEFIDPTTGESYLDRIKTISFYKTTGVTLLNSMQAYILSHNSTKTGVVSYSHNWADKVQYAYWMYQNAYEGGFSASGSNSATSAAEGSNLFEEAKAFNNHIKNINNNGNTITDNSNYPPQNGYAASNEVSVSYSDVDNSYLVGPFRITYNQDIYNVKANSTMAQRQNQDSTLRQAGANGSRVLFGAIVGSKLSGDAGEVKGYSFICNNPVQNNLYPSSGEEFYIKIPYSGNESFTTLTNLSFTYYSLQEYGGSMNELAGQYNDIKLIVKRSANGLLYFGPYSYCSESPVCNKNNSTLYLDGDTWYHNYRVHDSTGEDEQHQFVDNSGGETGNGFCDTCGGRVHTTASKGHVYVDIKGTIVGDGRCDTCGREEGALNRHEVIGDEGHCPAHGMGCGLLAYAKNGSQYNRDPYNIPAGSHIQGRGSTVVAKAGIFSGANSQGLFSLNSAWIREIYHEIGITFKNPIPLTMNMGGKVWEDNLAEGKESEANGINTGTDKPVKYVEVILHKLDGTVVKTTETDNNGNWSLTDIPIAQKYYIEFKYNGIVYQSLAENKQFAVEGSSKNNISEYMNNSSERNTTKYYNNSKAMEKAEWRISFNNKFATITNDKITDKNTGEAYSNNNSKTDLEYSITENNETNQNYASLITTDKDGRTLDKYKISATTQAAGIDKLPIDSSIHISNIDRTVAGITYNKVYPYLEHINLGLVKRSVVDLDIREDVEKSVVTINKNETTYKYNRRTDMEGLEIDIQNSILSPADSSKITYNTALYKSDYNYRIDDYKNTNNLNNNEEVIDKIYSSKVTDEELKVFVTYKIRVTNKSVDEQNYVGVNEIVNYYDETYTLVDKAKQLEIYKNATTQETESKTVAKASTYRLNTESSNTEHAIVWNTSNTKVNGYNVMTTTSLKDVRMKPGEYAIISVTFEVNKQDYENLKNSVIRGNKEQYTEVKSYSTYYDNNKDSNGNYTNNNYLGKIDCNSAPYNYTPGDKNYETDTSAAPIITIKLREDSEEDRKINGIVWEDSRTNTLESGQIVGDGELKDTEKTRINGVTIQLVELVQIDGKEYEYIWREMLTGDNTYKYVDNNGNLNDTAEEEIKNDTNSPFRSFLNISADKGKYEFSQFVAGNFVVRFKYGDTDKTVLTIENGGSNEKSYNGQDYKSTAYQTGKDSLKEEWFDLAKFNNNEKISDAKDNEAQRLRQIKYSSTISNYNGSVLASPDRNPGKTEDDKKLIAELEKETWMYADTAKISIRIEYNTNELKETDSRAYSVNNIDLGLEERPKTNIVLNKEITRLRLILANGKTQVDSNAGLMPDVNNGNLKKEHIRDTLNRTTLIYLDKELMQGSTIIIDYKITITNNSEINTVAGDKREFLNNINNPNNEKYEEIPEIQGKDSIGTYLGSTYYTGKHDASTELSILRINKVLDYVDNNITFRKEDNTGWNLYSLNKNSLEDGSKTYQDLQKNTNTFDKDNLINGSIKLNNNSMIVNESLNTDNMDPYSTKELKLTLSKVLSPGNDSEEMIYGNIAEILQYSTTTGRRDYSSVPGNQNPNLSDPDVKPEEPDTDWAKNISIMPPTGETPIYYVIGFIGAIILIVGIVIIKKFVLDSKK